MGTSCTHIALLHKMLRKKAKKGTPLPKRPPPPSVCQILEDMKNVDPSDPVFTALEMDEKFITSPVNRHESFAFEDNLSPLVPTLTGEENMDTNNQGNVEDMYKKAQQFIQSYNELKASPELLKGIGEDLSILGHQLSESVSALKCQAQLVLDKSLSDKDEKRS